MVYSILSVVVVVVTTIHNQLAEYHVRGITYVPNSRAHAGYNPRKVDP